MIEATPLDVTPMDATPSVLALENVMRTMPQYVPVTEHYFADGMYCRKVFRHAGVLVVGKVHKKEHFYMVIQGSIALIQPGSEHKVYPAGSVIVSQPGTKRAVLALEDSTTVTVHRTDKTVLAELEAELVEDDPLSMYGPGNELKSLEHQQ